MANATITGTASNFGSISGVLAGEAGTVAGTITGTVSGTLTGSVGVPGPGVPSDGLEGQILAKASDTSYDTEWIDNYATELRIVARNETGATLAKGTVVYINGASGNKPTLAKALATGDATSAQTLGMVSADILDNQNGEVTVRGLLAGLDTSAFAAGTQLYLSGTTAGAVTSTKPSAPVHLVYVGIVSRQHVNQGQVEVAVQNGFELHELHDVKITSVSNGQVLKYDSAQGLWVNGTDVGGVAWGGITGTLSSQTDLQTALDGKYSTTNPSGYITSSALTGYATESYVTTALGSYLTTASAASTYLTQANAASTYQTQAGMSSYLTTSTAASTYALKTNGELKGNFTLDGTTSSPNSDGSILIGSLSSGYSYLSLAAGDIQGRTYSAGNKTFILNATDGLQLYTSGQGVRFPDATTQTTAFIPGDYLSKAGNLSGLANTGTARTNLGLGTMATETAANYALLASPALTGTPTAPTAAAATNTTQIATTAFVQQEVPAASTTAAGKVELATNAEAIATTSTTLVPALATLPAILAKPELRSLAHISLTAISGSGGVTAGVIGWGVREMYLGSLAIGRGAFLYSNYATLANLWSRADRTKLDFSKKIWVAGKCCLGFGGATSYLGDANTMTRISLGGYNTNNTGDMTQKGIGFKKVGGTSSAISLTVHNGTTLTDVATTKTCADGEVIDWVIYSDGTGNVTLFINGTQEATTSAGPTGTTTAGYNTYREQVEATSTPGVRGIIHATGGWIYVEG